MAKATTITEAIKNWKEKTGQKALEVTLSFQTPPIQKMDNSLSILEKCEKLSLSTNLIEKIAGLSGLKHLKILALGRNQIKNLSGLENVSETLKELWISYNLIEKLKGVSVLKNLRVLYFAHNLELPKLEDLLFVGNPLYDSMEEAMWRIEASRRLPNLTKLDGDPIIREQM
ncbi:hypothetical protein L9F63_016792 [Diploptera punctata]|uniref:Dynein axonemal light chain 1 n=1 Tax=Diploptera punctata TaxID=6984 RepID=A0AAD8A154_DIPPU|nr:hypothetical protein L9F63_016792 [Diploptera punctata]